MSILSLIVSCSFPFQNEMDAQLTDISDELTFQKISHQGFMGGSVLYNPDKPSAGQLSKGVTVAIRLGYVDRQDVGNDDVVFSDRPDEAQFGILNITDINQNFVSFLVKLYDSKGVNLTTSSFSLKLGESKDINNDGFEDITYNKPLRKREGFEKAVYMTFLSSQDTLNTTMFSVLPEQYSRGVYPSGIIGINPNGRFVISKYEGTDNSARSMVYGVQKGDYIFDNVTGEYFIANENFGTRSARNIDELELVDETIYGIDSFYYSVEDFNNLITPQGLLSVLPSEIAGDIFELDTNLAVDKLNEILRKKDLIKEICNVNNEIIDDELILLLETVDTLTEYELVSLNRMFLDSEYEEFSPFLETGSTDVTEVLPLYSCILGEEAENSEDYGRVATFSEYQTIRNQITNNFSKYCKLDIITEDGGGLVKDFIKKVSNNKVNTDDIQSTLNVQLGIKGSFSISFSNVDVDLTTAIYVKTETLANLSKTYKKSLLPGGEKIVLFEHNEIPISLGAITFYVSCPLEIDIPLTVKGSTEISTSMFSGFVGLYGAGINIGANYGSRWVKWFKVWKKWVYRPDIYFDTYADAYTIKESAYYVGPQNDEIVDNKLLIDNVSSSVSINPYVAVGPKIRWSCLSAKVTGRVGIDTYIYMDIERNSKTNNLVFDGEATIDFILGLYCTPALKLSLPFGIGDKTLKTEFNLVNPVKYNLVTWKFL